MLNETITTGMSDRVLGFYVRLLLKTHKPGYTPVFIYRQRSNTWWITKLKEITRLPFLEQPVPGARVAAVQSRLVETYFEDLKKHYLPQFSEYFLISEMNQQTDLFNLSMQLVNDTPPHEIHGIYNYDPTIGVLATNDRRGYLIHLYATE